MRDLRRDDDPQAARPHASCRLLVVLLCIVTAAAAILSWWWWTHRSYATDLGGRALSLYWRLPNDGHRHVWLGRTGDGPWLAFDGYEYRGVEF